MKIRLILLTLFGVCVLACDNPDQGTDDPQPPAGQESEPAQAAGARPDWLPDAIALPGDFNILADRSVGSYTRLLQGQTAAGRSALLAEYREALSAAGYQVDTRAELVEQGIVRYQGNGLQEASIRFVRAVDGDIGVIQFDARLQNQ